MNYTVRSMKTPCRIRSALGWMLYTRGKTRWVVDRRAATIAPKRDAVALSNRTLAVCSVVAITNRELYCDD
jgi:hypothetical protein